MAEQGLTHLQDKRSFEIVEPEWTTMETKQMGQAF